MVMKAKINQKTLKLSAKWVKKLIELPESGMGYQIVDIVLQDKRVISKVVILSSEIIMLPLGYENITEKDIADIKLFGHGLVEDLMERFPVLGKSFRGDTLLLNIKDVNEVDQFGVGAVDDVVLYLLFSLVDGTLKKKTEKYLRKIRPNAKRIIFHS